ncbi:MAG: SCO1664 family protein, partial [Saccharothrix sp.]|nr:SCO1664 family protein [Saccharothrix sp.]
MRPGDDGVLDLLSRGRIEVEGRLVDASNATLFCAIALDGVDAQCVYKPVRGERPLWDFPDGTLAGREVATYLVSQAAGFGLVPPTVLRPGPFGPGMVQLWVDTREDDDLVDIVPVEQVRPGWRAVLRAHDRHGDPAVLVHADHP